MQQLFSEVDKTLVADKTEELMSLVQQWGSTYNLVGGQFDDGDMFQESQELKKNLKGKLKALVVALVAAQKMNAEALPKFNWGASTLDANAIQLLNLTPKAVENALIVEEVYE